MRPTTHLGAGVSEQEAEEAESWLDGYHDAVDARDMEAYHEFCANDIVVQVPSYGIDLIGWDKLKDLWTSYAQLYDTVKHSSVSYLFCHMSSVA